MTDFLDQAITAHMGWRGRLLNAIRGETALDPVTVRSDCNCDLGRWIYGEGAVHEKRREFQCVKALHKDFHRTAANVVTSIQEGRQEEARASVVSGEFRERSRAVVSAITNLKAVLEGRRAQSGSFLAATSLRTKSLLVSLAMLICVAAAMGAIVASQSLGVTPFLQVVIGAGAGVWCMAAIALGHVWTTRSLCTPIRGLTEAMLRLERGEYATSVPSLTRQDDIGSLAEAVAAFKASAIAKDKLEIQESETRRAADAQRGEHDREKSALQAEQQRAMEGIALGLGRLAKGDLTHRLQQPFSPEYDKIRADFNDAVGQLESAVRTVATSAASIRGGSNELSSATNDLARRTELQAASLEQTVAALNEVTVAVRKSASGSEAGKTMVEDAKIDADASKSIVDEATAAMNAIKTSSHQITSIIGVIDEIAFQTNLLALNAGVEAARAGDSGRGFAVVATGVRALAQRSADAAKEIRTLISTSGTQVDVGVRLVGTAGTTIRSISGKVGGIDSVVTEIATSGKEQELALGDINTALNNIDEVTQQNAAMVEEATAAAAQLLDEAEALTGLIESFTFSDDVQSHARESGAATRSSGSSAGSRRRLSRAV